MESFRGFIESDEPTVVHAQSKSQSHYNSLQQLSKAIEALYPGMGEHEVSGSVGYISPEQTNRSRKHYDLSHPDSITHLARSFQSDPTLGPIFNDLASSFKQVLQAYSQLQQGSYSYSTRTESRDIDRLFGAYQQYATQRPPTSRLDKHMEPVYQDTPQDRKQRTAVLVDRIGQIDTGINNLKDSIVGVDNKTLVQSFNQFYAKWKRDLPVILKYLGSAQQSAYARLRGRNG